MTDYRRSFDDMTHTLSRVSARRRELEAVVEELPQLGYEATSPDGSVTVTADWQGVLTGVKLGAAAVDLSAAHVVNNILHAYARAQQASAVRVAEILHIDDPNSVHPLHRSILARAHFQPTLQSTGAIGVVSHSASPVVEPYRADDDDEFDASSYRA